MDEIDISQPASSTDTPVDPLVQEEVNKEQEAEIAEQSRIKKADAQRVAYLAAENEARDYGQRVSSKLADIAIPTGDVAAIADATVNDYVDYLRVSDPGKYENTKSKLEAIRSIPKEKWDEEDQRFMRDLGLKATDIAARADIQKLETLNSNVDFKEYNRQSLLLQAEQKKLSDEIAAFNALPDAERTEDAATQMNARMQELLQKQNAIQEQTGVSDEVIKEYGKLAGNIRQLSDAVELQKYSKDYQQLHTLERGLEAESKRVFDDLEENGFEVGQVLRQASSTITKGVLSLMQLPKVVGDALGDTDYDPVDEAYDFAQKWKNNDFAGVAPKSGEKTLEDLGFGANLSVIGGSALGSIALFGTGGALGGASNIGRSVATFGTSFATTQSDFYQEAINAGMDPDDAAQSALALAALTSIVETAVPDVKYFDPVAFKNAVLSNVAKGMKSREAMKAAVDGIRERVVAYAKTAGKESLEEEVQQGAEDTGKEVINALGGQQYFTDTFDPKAYRDNLYGTLFATGTMQTIMGSSKPQSPMNEAMIREAAENADDLVPVLSEMDPAKAAEAQEQIETAKENLEALKTHSKWDDISTEKQNAALGITQRISALKEEQRAVKSVGATDVAREEQIAALQEELNKALGEPIETEKTEKPAAAPAPVVAETVPEPVVEAPVTETAPSVDEAIPEKQLSHSSPQGTKQDANVEPAEEKLPDEEEVIPPVIDSPKDEIIEEPANPELNEEQSKETAVVPGAASVSEPAADDTGVAVEAPIQAEKEPPSPPSSKIDTDDSETRERKFVTSVRESRDISEETKAVLTQSDRINYQRIPNAVTIGEAKAIVEAIGTEEARRAITTRSSGMAPRVRVAMGQMLIKKYNEEKNYQAAVEVTEDIAELLTEEGQAVQAASMLKFLSPEGQLLAAQREVNKQREAKMGQRTHKKRVQKLKKGIELAKKEAVDEALKAVDEDIKKTTVSTPKQPKRPSAYGSKNRIVTKDQYEDAKKALRTKLFAVAGVPPPELIQIAAFHIEAGARDFGEFSKRMLEDFGERVKDYLQASYDEAIIDLDRKTKEKDIEQLTKEFGRLLSEKITPNAPRKTKVEKLAELAQKLNELTGSTDYGTLVNEFGVLESERLADHFAEVQQREEKRKEEREEISRVKTEEKAKERASKKEKRSTERQEKAKDKEFSKEEKAKNRADEKIEREATSEKGIREALKDLGTSIQEVVRSHYSQQNATKKMLIDKLVAESGLTLNDARMLAEKIEEKFVTLLEQRRRAAVQSIFTRMNRNKKGVKNLEDKIIELSNLGSFDEALIDEAYADALGFPKLTAEDAKEINRLAEIVQKAQTQREENRATEDLLRFQEKVKGFSWMDASLSLWISHILSGPITQSVNIISNAYNTAALFVTAGIRTGNPRFIAKGLAVGLKRGLIEGWDALKTGYAPIRGKVEIPNILERTTFKGGKFNPANYAKYVRRFMLAADTVSFEGLRQMRSFQLALKMAAEEKNQYPDISTRQRALDILNRGDTALQEAADQAKEEMDDKISRIQKSMTMEENEKKRLISEAKNDERFRIYELLEKSRPEKITTEAHEYAAKGTFNHTPEGVLGLASTYINGFTRQAPIFKLAIPFVNVLSNVANNQIDYTPLGFIRARKDNASISGYGKRELTEQERSDLYVKALMGTSLMVIVFMMTKLKDDEDDPILEITANGYGDFSKNADLIANGWRPYSFRVKNPVTGEYSGWISYQYSPFMTGLSYIGNTNDFEKYRKEKFNDSWYTKQGVAASGVVRSFFDQTFLQSADGFVSALVDSRDESLVDNVTSWAGKTGTSVIVPGLVSQTDRLVGDWMDTPEKEVRETFMGRVAKNLPVARDQYYNRVNGLGEDITKQADIMISISEAGPTDKLWNLLADKKGTIGVIPRNSPHLVVDGQERVMTDQEFFQFSKIRGSFIKTVMEENYDRLEKMDSEEFGKWLAKAKTFGTTIGKVFADKDIPVDTDNFFDYIKDNYASEYIKTYMTIPNKNASNVFQIEGELMENAIINSQ